jgi:hypothetical protein
MASDQIRPRDGFSVARAKEQKAGSIRRRVGCAASAVPGNEPIAGASESLETSASNDRPTEEIRP